MGIQPGLADVEFDQQSQEAGTLPRGSGGSHHILQMARVYQTGLQGRFTGLVYRVGVQDRITGQVYIIWI